ncbi:MAG TPA: hypothetical protein DHV28_06230 [Ignavibacteriales bacterium]|nr:hypothetical protein [Ignavibacteriales bacterium]
MNTIPYPDKLDEKFYERTIQANPNIVLDGFYFGPFDRKYEQSRADLTNSYKLIFVCDYWLDAHYYHDNRSYFHVPDKRVLELIEKYYDITIPMGCLAIAVKHRDEMHVMAPDGNGFDLIFNKAAFRRYLELHIDN